MFWPLFFKTFNIFNTIVVGVRYNTEENTQIWNLVLFIQQNSIPTIHVKMTNPENCTVGENKLSNNLKYVVDVDLYRAYMTSF